MNGNCTVGTAAAPKNDEGVTDIYCVQTVNGVCTNCSNGYYYNKQEGLCKQVDTLCKGHDKETGFCTDCYQGFTLSVGKCVI